MSLPSGRKHPGTQYGTIRRFRYNPSDSMQNGHYQQCETAPSIPQQNPAGLHSETSVPAPLSQGPRRQNRTTLGQRKNTSANNSRRITAWKNRVRRYPHRTPKIPARINKPSLHRQPKVSPRCRHHLSNIIRYEQIHRCSIKREPPDIGWLSTSLCCVGAQGFEPRTLCL